MNGLKSADLLGIIMDHINYKCSYRPSNLLVVNYGNGMSSEAITVVSASGSFLKRNNVSCR